MLSRRTFTTFRFELRDNKREFAIGHNGDFVSSLVLFFKKLNVKTKYEIGSYNNKFEIFLGDSPIFVQTNGTARYILDSIMRPEFQQESICNSIIEMEIIPESFSLCSPIVSNQLTIKVIGETNLVGIGIIAHYVDPANKFSDNSMAINSFDFNRVYHKTKWVPELINLTNKKKCPKKIIEWLSAFDPHYDSSPETLEEHKKLRIQESDLINMNEIPKIKTNNDWIEYKNKNNSGTAIANKSDHNVTKTDHNVTKTDHNVTKTDHNVTKTDHNVTKTDHNVTKTDHNVTKTDHSVNIADLNKLIIKNKKSGIKFYGYGPAHSRYIAYIETFDRKDVEFIAFTLIDSTECIYLVKFYYEIFSIIMGVEDSLIDSGTDFYAKLYNKPSTNCDRLVNYIETPKCPFRIKIYMIKDSAENCYFTEKDRLEIVIQTTEPLVVTEKSINWFH